MKIITNNRARPIIYGFELSEKEKREFDYMSDIDSASFFRYKNTVYDLGEFQRVTDTMGNCHGFDGWQGYYGDSFFSGIVIKYTDEFESVVVGRWYS